MINSAAGAIIVNEGLKDGCNTNTIVVKDAYLAYSILSHKFKLSQNADNLSFGNEVNYYNTQIASSSLIGQKVEIGHDTIIHNNCVIEDNTSIGKGCLIESNVTIQQGSVIGDN